MKNLPIKLHVYYILGTMLFSFFGTRVYVEYNKFSVAIFISLYLMIVIAGFNFGLKFKLKRVNVKSFLNPYKVFLGCLFFIFIAYSYNLYHLHSIGNLNLNIAEVGQNYVDFYKNYKKETDSIFTYEIIFLVIVAIPKFVILALGFFFFKSLPRLFKLLLVADITMIILSHTIAMGNQKSLADIIIFGMIGLMIYASRLTLKKRRVVFRRAFGILFLFFVFLAYSQHNRFGSKYSVTVEGFNKIMSKYSKYDPDHVVFKTLGVPAGLGVSHIITGYLSGGYYGLSKTLELPFEWSYGVGNSLGLSTIVKRVTGEDPYKKTYLHRMDKKYRIPGKRNWHSIFPWIASDITFLGSLILFFILSIIYGRTWKEVLKYKNPVSLLLFSLLTIMFVFVPANNQIFHGFDYISITLFIFFYWLIFHNKYNYNRKQETQHLVLTS